MKENALRKENFKSENRQKEPHILLLEDNPADAELLEFKLQSSGFFFTLKHVEDKKSYIQALKDFYPDIILSDYELPSLTGWEALQIRKKLCPETPFILVTGAIGEERAIEVLTGGATDYVLKKNLAKLPPAIHRALHEAYEHRKRKEAEAERDRLFRELEFRVEERTIKLQSEITERKRAEQALQEARDELEDRVIVRTNNLIAEIAERIRIENEKNKLIKELDEERSRLKAIIDSLPVGLWMADADGKMTYVNERAKSIWGGEAPLADNIEEYGKYKARWPDTGISISPQDMPLARALKGETIHEKEIDIQSFDGKEGTQLISAAPVKTSEGKIIGSVAVVQDITEYKKRKGHLI